MKTHISIDMGAKNNGVFLAHTKDGKIIDKTATNYIFEPSSINFLKKDRTKKRHQRRGFKRTRLARRLLDEIIKKLKKQDLSQAEYELLYGLLKNRGFNYINIEFENDLSDESLEILNEIDDYEFKNCVSKNDYELRLSEIANEYDIDEFCEFLAKQVALITQKDENDKDIYKIADKKSILQMFEALRNEMLKNNKHRERYLKDIKELCQGVEFKSVISKLNISVNEFANIIGNISNYQTRVLRRYFNKKFDDNFDDEKLRLQSIKNINFLSYQGKTELENKRIMLENLKNSSYEYLCKNDPKTSIPPYERMNNKSLQTCNVLILKDNLSKSLKTCLKHILENPNFSSLTMDENGVIKEYNALDENELKVVFQRFLDISKGYLEDIKLYPRGFYKYAKYFKDTICLNDSDFDALQDFANKYYDELLLAKKGVLSNKLLKPCGCHTPYKNNLKHTHLSILWAKPSGFSEDDVNTFVEFINNKANKIKGNTTLKGFLTHLSKTAKAYQNAFYKALEDEKALLENNTINDKELKKILEQYEKAYEIITSQEIFKNVAKSDKLKTMINQLLQTTNIILDDTKGFNKLCKEHSLQSLLRTSGEKAMCSVFGSDSARLINGKVEMYIDRLAYEVVKDIDLSKSKELHVNIEQNAFNFETAAEKLKLTKRKPKEHFVICPYSGEKLNLNNAEYDHILPRSKCEYNSEANLIPVKSYENLRKKDAYMMFDALHENYKNNLYKQCKVSNEKEFKAFINDTLSKINPDDYTNYKNLKYYEQIAFRHALFMPDESFYTKALELLKQDKLKTTTNGTQKRLAKLIVQKALAKNKDLNIYVKFVDSRLTSAIRHELSKNLPELKKEEKQQSHSHCIDASVVFYIANAAKDSKTTIINDISNKFEPKYDFNEIYLQESIMKSPKSKVYLELEQKEISRKQLFKDTIYSLRYEKAESLSNEHVSILKELDLLMEVKKLKSVKVHINTKKVFDLIFASFKAKDIKTLEKIKFLDKFLVSSVRKDILDIFFDAKSKELIKPKDKGANIEKFYEILVKNGVKDKSEVEKIQKLYIDSFYTGNQKNIKRARDKRRVTYSLSVAGGANFVVRRNTGYEGLANENIATKNYFDKDKIVGIKYYTKNVLPCKIEDIIKILSLSDNATEIYKLSITKDLPPKIIKLEYEVSQADRHTVKVYFDKVKLGYDLNIFKGDLSLKNEEWVKFCNECLISEFAEFLGKPRDYKASIICDNFSVLGFSYSADRTSKANREIMKDNIC